MEEEFYRVLNKYQGYGWDSLTKEEQTFYSDNYPNFKDNERTYDLSFEETAKWLGEVRATGDTAAYYAAWGQLNDREKEAYLKNYASEINAYKKNLVFPSVIRNEDGVIISENKRGLQGDKTPNPKYYTGNDGRNYIQNVPELLVTDTPINTGVYIKEFEDRNPKPRTRNDLGWYTDSMLKEWEDRRNKYVVEGIIKDKPELLSALDYMDREEIVEMINGLSPTTQKFLATDERFQQSYWQDMVDGLSTIGALEMGSADSQRAAIMRGDKPTTFSEFRINEIQNDPTKTDYEKEQLIGQYQAAPVLSALGEVFNATEAPVNILYRSAKALVDPESTLENALLGKRSNMSFDEELAVDVAYETGMFLATGGLSGLLKSIPKGLAKRALRKSVKVSDDVFIKFYNKLNENEKVKDFILNNKNDINSRFIIENPDIINLIDEDDLLDVNLFNIKINNIEEYKKYYPNTNIEEVKETLDIYSSNRDFFLNNLDVTPKQIKIFNEEVLNKAGLDLKDFNNFSKDIIINDKVYNLNKLLENESFLKSLDNSILERNKKDNELIFNLIDINNRFKNYYDDTGYVLNKYIDNFEELKNSNVNPVLFLNQLMLKEEELKNLNINYKDLITDTQLVNLDNKAFSILKSSVDNPKTLNKIKTILSKGYDKDDINRLISQNKFFYKDDKSFNDSLFIYDILKGRNLSDRFEDLNFDSFDILRNIINSTSAADIGRTNNIFRLLNKNYDKNEINSLFKRAIYYDEKEFYDFIETYDVFRKYDLVDEIMNINHKTRSYISKNGLYEKAAEVVKELKKTNNLEKIDQIFANGGLYEKLTDVEKENIAPLISELLNTGFDDINEYKNNLLSNVNEYKNNLLSEAQSTAKDRALKQLEGTDLEFDYDKVQNEINSLNDNDYTASFSNPKNATGFYSRSEYEGTKPFNTEYTEDGYISADSWVKWGREYNPAFNEGFDDIAAIKANIPEYRAIEMREKANGTWMKNADGSDFSGSPEMFVQQKSAAFKKAYPDETLMTTNSLKKNIGDKYGSEFLYEKNISGNVKWNDEPLIGIHSNKVNQNDFSYFDETRGGEVGTYYGWGQYTGTQQFRKLPIPDNLKDVPEELLPQKYKYAMPNNENLVDDNNVTIRYGNNRTAFYQDNINPILAVGHQENELIKDVLDNETLKPDGTPFIVHDNRFQKYNDNDISYLYYLKNKSLFESNVDGTATGIVHYPDNKKRILVTPHEVVTPYARPLKSALGNNGLFDRSNYWRNQQGGFYRALVPAAIGAGALQMFNDSYEEQSSRPPSERIGLPPL